MLDPEKFPSHEVVSKLQRRGAVAVPMLSDESRSRLLAETERFAFKDRSGVVGAARVKQEFGAFSNFPSGSSFLALSACARLLCRNLMERAGARFDPHLSFNEHVLQKYPPHSAGITPHIDSIRCRNLVIVFVLDGDGDFAICDDRSGRNPQVIYAPPGYAIFMAAAGLCGRTEQQFHYLNNIVKGRTSFGIRQVLPKHPAH